MFKDIKYKGRQIERIFPSGYYRIYSYSDERFLTFDDLDSVKDAINRDIAQEHEYED
jgi:hypothetical protein